MNISRAQCSPAAGSVFQRASDIKSNSKRFFHDLSLLVIVCLRVRQPELPEALVRFFHHQEDRSGECFFQQLL